MTQSAYPVGPALPEEIVRNLLRAQEKEDFENFISRGTPVFKERLTKSIFFIVCEKVSQHLAAGYELEFLAELNQKHRRLYVWKLTFANGIGELLVRLWLSPKQEVSGIMMDGASSL